MSMQGGSTSCGEGFVGCANARCLLGGLLLIESRLGVPLKRVSMFVHPLFQLAAA